MRQVKRLLLLFLAALQLRVLASTIVQCKHLLQGPPDPKKAIYTDLGQLHDQVPPGATIGYPLKSASFDGEFFFVQFCLAPGITQRKPQATAEFWLDKSTAPPTGYSLVQTARDYRLWRRNRP